MTLWFVLGLMTMTAIFAVLWPLGRKSELRTDNDLAVYRAQLEELDADRSAGRIGESEAAAARVEISRRLIAAADQAATVVAPADTPWPRRAVALAALVLLPVLAGGIYLALGSPHLPGEPLAARQDRSPDQDSVQNLITRVEAHLVENPQDGRGWEVLAPVYMRLGRYEDAVKARENALRTMGTSADREANLGEAIAAAAGGVVTPDAKAAFDRALALEPQEPKSRFFLGLAAEQDGRAGDAAKIWRDLLATASPEARWIGVVREALARVEGDAPPTPNEKGPTEKEVSAANELSPEQRAEMVQGMVARLAERLKTESSDIEGWLRLLRSYVVLGDSEKARAAAADARRALANEPDKLRRLNDAIKGLGLEG
jgi:cytochrome c-type biogenesis protein CcmH